MRYAWISDRKLLSDARETVRRSIALLSWSREALPDRWLVPAERQSYGPFKPDGGLVTDCREADENLPAAVV